MSPLKNGGDKISGPKYDMAAFQCTTVTLNRWVSSTFGGGRTTSTSKSRCCASLLSSYFWSRQVGPRCSLCKKKHQQHAQAWFQQIFSDPRVLRRKYKEEKSPNTGIVLAVLTSKCSGRVTGDSMVCTYFFLVARYPSIVTGVIWMALPGYSNKPEAECLP